MNPVRFMTSIAASNVECSESGERLESGDCCESGDHLESGERLESEDVTNNDSLTDNCCTISGKRQMEQEDIEFRAAKFSKQQI